MEYNNRDKIANKGSIVGVIGNLILSVGKIVTGLFTGSMAILADGLDSAIDVMTSMVTLASTRIASKPPDREHPYGHERAEAIAAKIIAMIVFFAGGELAITSIKKLFLEAPVINNLGLVLGVALMSALGKYFLYRYKLNIGKKINSSVFIADAVNMRSDILISLSVFGGIFLIMLTGLTILDTIVGLIVSAFVIKSAVEIFLQSSTELMDGIPGNDNIYKRVFEAVNTVEGASNPHKVRIRKMGHKYLVDMDIEVDGNLTVQKAHEIAKEIEEAIMTNEKSVYDVHVHIEPLGNVESENFGISVETTRKDRHTKG